MDEWILGLAKINPANPKIPKNPNSDKSQINGSDFIFSTHFCSRLTHYGNKEFS
jgi:hypothetical protein